MQIEIKSTTVFTKTVQRKNGQGSLDIREQQAAFVIPGEDYPQAFRLSLGEYEAYKPGLYNIHPDSFRVNNFKGLEIGRLFLVPAQTAQK